MPPSTTPPESPWLDAAVELMGQVGRRGLVRVQGDSMRPSLPPGSTLLVDFAPADPRVGDVLLFRQSGTLVVHRFLARVTSKAAGPCFRTRGDNTPALDPPVLAGSVLGTVRAVDRGTGWRTLEGAPARGYEIAVAAHDHAWAAAFWVMGRVDGRLRRLGVSPFLQRITAAADRTALRVADAVLFRPMHRRMSEPTL